MSEANVEVVRQLYAAFIRRDVAAILKLTSPQIRVEQSRDLPWGGTYEGHAGLQAFFEKLMGHLENHALPIQQYLDAGEHVVAIGRTQGIVRATGKAFDVPLAHVWEVRDGQALSFRPYIDHPTMYSKLA